MGFFKRGKRSQRKRKAWLSLWYTLVGIVVVTGLVGLLERRRDTDLTDPTAGVTSRFKDSEEVEKSNIRFRDVAETMGVVMRHGPGLRGRALPEDTGSGIAWGDYDGDGDWDLYAVNYPGALGKEPNSTGANRLYRNDGGHFTDVTETAGVGNLEGFGMGASFADYDSDGDVDLYVTNFGPNRLYQNGGDGTFKEVAEEAGVADPLWSAGVAWGDFDKDGHLDFYVCNYVHYDAIGFEPEPEVGSSFGMYEAPFTLNPNSFNSQPNRLYRNRGDGTFEEMAEICAVSNPDGRSLGATFCDLDGDAAIQLF